MPPPPWLAPAPAKLKTSWPSRKKSRFSGKQHAEARQVHLRLIVFHLGEVGVVGKVGDERLRDAPLGIHAELRLAVVDERRRGAVVGRRGPEDVGLDVHAAELLGRLQVHEAPGHRHHRQPAPAERDRHLREERQLVLPPHHATEVDAPFGAAFLEAHRAEGNDELRRPAALEVGRADVDQAVPVVARLLVGDLPVEQARLGVHRKPVAVAVVVERVEEHRDVIVVVHVRRVAPHVARHAPGRVGLPHARADVDVPVVEEHPHLRLVGGGLAFVGLLLDEVAGALHVPVERLVQLPVHLERRRQPHRPEDGMALGIARHDLRRHGVPRRRRRRLRERRGREREEKRRDQEAHDTLSTNGTTASP